MRAGVRNLAVRRLRSLLPASSALASCEGRDRRGGGEKAVRKVARPRVGVIGALARRPAARTRRDRRVSLS